MSDDQGLWKALRSSMGLGDEARLLRPRRTFLGRTGTLVLGGCFLVLGVVLFQNVLAVWPTEGSSPDPRRGSSNDIVADSPTSVQTDSTPAPPQSADSLAASADRNEPVTQALPATSDSLRTSEPIEFPLVFSYEGGVSVTTDEQRLLILTLVMGALGSWLHSLSSFLTFVGNRSFVRSWIPWYLLRPFVGSGLALVFYVVIRANLGPNAGGELPINPYGVAAFASLVGLFTQRATHKLADVFDALFSPRRAEADPLEQTEPPVLELLIPHELQVGGGDAKVAIVGRNFLDQSIPLVDGEPRPVTARSADRVVMTVSSSQLAAEKELIVTVRNPGETGGDSNPIPLPVRR
ncbi:MAG: hypothetical protein MJB57_07200 [Gemmatimonadetes bacterium]|nr:hypothetical protein [Gemmatimonadota bacterium]